MRLDGKITHGMVMDVESVGADNISFVFGPVGAYIDPSLYYTKEEIDAMLANLGAQSDWDESDSSSKAYIKNKPELATVATSGNYNDLRNKPTIPAAQVQSDWNEASSSSKAYIQNKPTIPTVPTNVSAFNNDAGYLTQHQSIKTVNGISMVGSGDVSTKTPVVEVSGATVTQTLNPNTFYKFTGSVTSLTLTLGSEVSGITNIYAFSFTAGQDNPTISISPSVTIADAPDIHSGDYVEFSIMDGKAIAKVWSV